MPNLENKQTNNNYNNKTTLFVSYETLQGLKITDGIEREVPLLIMYPYNLAQYPTHGRHSLFV